MQRNAMHFVDARRQRNRRYCAEPEAEGLFGNMC